MNISVPSKETGHALVDAGGGTSQASCTSGVLKNTSTGYFPTPLLS